MEKKIIRNSATCRRCKADIESKHRHDFVSCPCGAIAVDGGKEYLRRAGDFEHLEETSILEDDPNRPPVDIYP